MHPAAGTYARQGRRLDAARQAVRERGELEPWMTGELRVQRAQKIVAVEGVVLPGVLAVERDEHGVIAALLVVTGELQQSGCESEIDDDR